MEEIEGKTYVMLCAIWYHLYYLKNMENIHGGVLLKVVQMVPNCAKRLLGDFEEKKKYILLPHIM